MQQCAVCSVHVSRYDSIQIRCEINFDKECDCTQMISDPSSIDERFCSVPCGVCSVHLGNYQCQLTKRLARDNNWNEINFAICWRLRPFSQTPNQFNKIVFEFLLRKSKEREELNGQSHLCRRRPSKPSLTTEKESGNTILTYTRYSFYRTDESCLCLGFTFCCCFHQTMNQQQIQTRIDSCRSLARARAQQ